MDTIVKETADKSVTAYQMMDGNEAAAHVAYRTSEVIAIYPITPASSMGEISDAWYASEVQNLWGEVPRVMEMQSEGGAAGAVHGALQAGALSTTFTSSQGLLLMIPNFYKIAGELTSTVIHIAARSLAAQALSIFGDHSDVMAARSTGWAMLFSSSVQEVMDLSLVSFMSTLETRIPFMHIFDGFRTSHEVAKIKPLSEADMLSMIDPELIRAHRARSLSPDRPVLRGTAQNPDVYFQSREACNRFYAATPAAVQKAMDRLGALTGRPYSLFEYHGHPEAERIVILMGSGAETVFKTVTALVEAGEKVGAVKVRLYRPWSAEHLNKVIPASVRHVVVLDRTKEPGAPGEPLFQDVVASLYTRGVRIIGGRYGLSSKEFTPAMARAALDELKKDNPRNSFTLGINDDVTGSSLEYDPSWDLETSDTVRAMFWGLGADGTVSANKSSIKIIGEGTDRFAQGYFVYDSKKSGARTISHLRFGPRPINEPYLLQRADFVAVHQFDFLERYPVLELADEGSTFLINSPFGPDDIWERLPLPLQEILLQRHMKMYVVDASKVARDAGLSGRINTVMQTCFFALAKVLPRDEAIAHIKKDIEKNYGKRGPTVLQQNFTAVDMSLANLHEVKLSGRTLSGKSLAPPVSDAAPEFVRNVLGPIMAGAGDSLPVSAMPVDGTFPTATAKWEKRNLADTIPIWEPPLCIECGKCVLVCPHAAIRAKLVSPDTLADAPEGFKTYKSMFKERPDDVYTLQVAVEDCTGCGLCVDVCPAKDKSNASRKAINMQEQRPVREELARHWDFFLQLRDGAPDLKYQGVKDIQVLQPLFEFSGACSGCGETPYLKLLTQLFGDHTMVANATGCSSIYGANLPTTPWAVNGQGRGPAWSNSLFEDNAEFGLGMRLAIDRQKAYAEQLMNRLGLSLDGEGDIYSQIARLKAQLVGRDDNAAKDLMAVAEHLAPRSIWLVGGDGWAYDIGYGGLDHVLSSGANVNILVLDTEVYSNTGGQASKSTPLGAVAKFAAGGKATGKKDLGMLAVNYGNVYVSQIAMGANDTHTVRAMREAEAYPGVSLTIAYSQCIAHGIDMTRGMRQQKLAVETGQWLLYRYDPRVGLQLDCKAPTRPVREFLESEGRFRLLFQQDPERAREFVRLAQEGVDRRRKHYENLAVQS